MFPAFLEGIPKFSINQRGLTEISSPPQQELIALPIFSSLRCDQMRSSSTLSRHSSFCQYSQLFYYLVFRQSRHSQEPPPTSCSFP